MRIALIRHGRPDINRDRKITPRELSTWLTDYRLANVTSSPAGHAIEAATSSEWIVCSQLVRSIDSAKMLGVDPHVKESLFDEVGLPSLSSTYPLMRAGTLSVIARCLWHVGLSTGCENRRKAKARAQLCALRLHELASRHNSVALVGHGMLNILIAQRLRRVGWSSSVAMPWQGYWHVVMLTRE